MSAGSNGVTLEEVAREQMELDCRVVCTFCHNGEPHDAPPYPCNDIRAAFERRAGEGEK